MPSDEEKFAAQLLEIFGESAAVYVADENGVRSLDQEAGAEATKPAKAKPRRRVLAPSDEICSHETFQSAFNDAARTFEATMLSGECSVAYYAKLKVQLSLLGAHICLKEEVTGNGRAGGEALINQIQEFLRAGLDTEHFGAEAVKVLTGYAQAAVAQKVKGANH